MLQMTESVPNFEPLERLSTPPGNLDLCHIISVVCDERRSRRNGAGVVVRVQWGRT